MTLPNISLTITDGALGLSQESVDRILAIVGASSSGTANSIVPVTSPQDVVSTFGYGPLAEAAAYHLQTAGGTVLAVKTTTTAGSAGAASAVTSSPASPVGSGTLAVTGTPYDKYSVKVMIVVGGNNGTATFKYSLDGGDTYSDIIATSATSPWTYAIAHTGLTLSFTSGSGDDWVAGEYYTFTTTAPEPGAADVGTALDALLADSREWRAVHIVGNATPYVTSTSSTSFSTCTTAKTKMTTAENAYRYTYAVCEARDQAQGVTNETEANWISSVAAGTSAFESTRVSLVGGTCKLQSAISLPGRTYARRSVAWPILAQRLKLSKSDDSGWVAKTGSMPGIAALYHNEESTPGLDTARLTTARTLIGVNGYYCTHMRMMSAATSDFRFVQYREVMDEACRLARLGMLKYLNAKLRVDSKTGYIDVRDAIAIEQYVGGLVQAGLSGEVSDSSVAVARADNILSTQTLRATLRIKPMAYAKYISVDLGFTNPALSFEAA